MKKLIITGIVVIACVALCTTMWLRSAKVGDLPVKSVKNAVNAGIEARSEEKTHITPSDNVPAPETGSVEEREPPKTDVTTVIDDKPHIWIPGFGWIVDKGGGSIGTMVEVSELVGTFLVD